jgi:phthiodiolone/phenolphthiodiolone dimycocerosates ketoreductase
MLTTGIPFDTHRTTPLRMVAPWVEALRAAEIDTFWAWDELSGWFPDRLWRAENTPLAAMRDAHSTQDPFLLAAVAAAHDPTIDLRLTTDAIRSHPADVLRRMLTLAANTEGRAVLALGAGELRQAKPLGFKRSQGIARLEDAFRIWRLLLESNGPVSYDGRYWSLENASLGMAKERIPELWALGGGPRLIECAAEFGDGFETGVPASFASPEVLAPQIRQLREKVERHGRDPDTFGIGIWVAALVHDDPDVIARAKRNPIVRFYSAMYGRFNEEDWRRFGISPVLPHGYHYAVDYLPFLLGDKEAERIVREVPDEMVDNALYAGSPAEVAEVCRQYVDAGVTFVGLLDMMPMFTVGSEPPEQAFSRQAVTLASLTASVGAQA